MTIHRFPTNTKGCPHNIKPHRVLLSSSGRAYIAYCNICGGELGYAPTKEAAEQLEIEAPPDNVESAYHAWLHEDTPLLEAAQLFNVSPESIMQVFKEEDPKRFYISTAKGIIAVALLLIYTNLKQKLWRASRGRLNR